MAELRKVQFVTLSAFAAGAGAGAAAAAAAEPRKRRLEDETDFNLGRAGEVETASGAGGGAGGDRSRAKAQKRATVRLNLTLSEPSDVSSVEFNYGELIQNLQEKNNPPLVTSSRSPDDPFNDDERERLQVEALAKKFEDKYGNTGKKKRKDRMQDLIDIGFGYDETDPFIDNSEAYDELVPASLTTKLGGFYINTGTLQFRAASDSEGEANTKTSDNQEQVIKKRKKKELSNSEQKTPKKNRGPKQGVTAFGSLRPEKKKRKKLMKDSLYLAAMLRRFTREKEELKKRNQNMNLLGQNRPEANKIYSGNTANHLLPSSLTNPQGNALSNELSLAELTSDPAVMSLLGSANEKELQDLLGDLDFSLLDSEQQHAVAAARENGILGVGGGVQGRGLGSSSGLFSPPPLPVGLPGPLIKRIEDLRAASRQFDQEGRKKFFTLDMNNILLDIELQVQEHPPDVRSGIYSHMEAFVPCNKEALLKRLKKLSLNIQDDRMRNPLLKLKLAVCSVMPEQIAKYNMECMAKVAKQQSEEGDKNGSEDEDEDKPGKRVMGPRKKFVWDDKLRNLLCNLVRVKLSCYEMEKQCSLSVEDYLKAFLETEVKPLWPKGWMQARILLKESLSEGPWTHKAPLTVAHPPSLPTSALTSRQLSSQSEPICLSDSLDEDLIAPSLDSISYALAPLSNTPKGQNLTDSPLSPPPLQIPTSSPPPVTPHYPSASSVQQISLSNVEAAQPGAASGTSPCAPTSSSSSPLTTSGTVGQGQTQRLVTMASANHRPSSVISSGGGTPQPHPSPSPPKQRPLPTASPLVSPHQKGFGNPVGLLGCVGLHQGLSKSGAKGSSTTPSSSPSSQPRTSSSTHPSLHSFCPPSPVTSSPSPATQSTHLPQSKSHSHHHHQQSNFITPMQATLTKSPHSKSSSPIIKLTPRPPAPNPPPSTSPSSSSSPSSQMLANQQHQYSTKSFRSPYGAPTSAQLKPPAGGCSFAGAQKPQTTTSGNSSAGNNSANMDGFRNIDDILHNVSPVTGEALEPPRRRPSGRVHISDSFLFLQVSSAGSSLLGTPPALPLGFGMLGSLVPVSLPFQFPPLLNFSPPGASGAAGIGSASNSNSGYALAQNDLMDLYKSLQSGSQAALPPHLQLAFSGNLQSSSSSSSQSSCIIPPSLPPSPPRWFGLSLSAS
uniref:Ubinuclein 2a n=1 Tax=Takifugu rubripes TaxID=31033 RepID=A0A674NS47_TAKRU